MMGLFGPRALMASPPVSDMILPIGIRSASWKNRMRGDLSRIRARVSLMSPLAYIASQLAVMAWVPAASAITLAVLPLPPPLVPAR